MTSGGFQMNSAGFPDEFWWLPRLILVASQMNSAGFPDEFW